MVCIMAVYRKRRNEIEKERGREGVMWIDKVTELEKNGDRYGAGDVSEEIRVRMRKREEERQRREKGMKREQESSTRKEEDEEEEETEM